METVKVVKDGITKEIQKKDLSLYLSRGWIEVKAYQPYQQFKKIV